MWCALFGMYILAMCLLIDLLSTGLSMTVGDISGTGAVSTLMPSYRDMASAAIILARHCMDDIEGGVYKRQIYISRL